MQRLSRAGAALLVFPQVRSFAFRRTKVPLLCEANMADRLNDLKLDNSYSNHKNPHMKQFDIPTFIFLSDGVEHDFMDDVRDCLHRHCQVKTSFVNAKTWTHREVLEVAKDVVKICNVSFRDYPHTPRRFWALFEVLAMCDAALAITTAEHFLFAHFVATHATSATSEKIFAQGADDVGFLGAIAVQEALGDGVQMHARIDHYDKSVFLHGVAKFAVVNGTTARWLLVSANAIKATTSMGQHFFFVRIRNDAGALLPGVTVQAVNDGTEGLGMAVIHFNYFRVSPEFLAAPSTFNEKFEIVTASPAQATEATSMWKPDFSSFEVEMQKLALAKRLVAGALYCGTAKRTFTNLVNFVAKRKVSNVFNKQDYFLFGMQHIQTPVCALGSTIFGLILAWQKITDIFGDTSKSATQVQHQELHSVLHFLVSALSDIEQLSSTVMREHAVFHCSSLRDLRLVRGILGEGEAGGSASHHARTATKGIMQCTSGASEAPYYARGWYGRQGKKYARLKRMMMQPSFTPWIPSGDSYQTFFRNKHIDVRERLRFRMTREVNMFGNQESAWYLWNSTLHEDVTKCGEALGEAFIVKSFNDVINRCVDEPSQQYLMQLMVFFAMMRMVREKGFLCKHGLMADEQAARLEAYLDERCFNVAPNLLRATLALRVPDAFLGPSHVGLEEYWSIPGTVTDVEKGTAVVAKTDSGRRTERKSDQEKIREESDDPDYLHSQDEQQQPPKDTTDSKKGDPDKKYIEIDSDKWLRKMANWMSGKS